MLFIQFRLLKAFLRFWNSLHFRKVVNNIKIIILTRRILWEWTENGMNGNASGMVQIEQQRI